MPNSTPPDSSELHLIPLGGLGEIGLNCMVIEYEGRILIIDAGLMFPDANMPGVDLVIPDFTYLIENAEKINGLILTHGHEDHIGAVGFLLKEIDIPVFGTRLTLALAQEKLKERGNHNGTFIEIAPREKITLNPFDLEFIRVDHSILDGVAVAINTPMGSILHTGDFKIDQASSDNRIDLYKFAEYGEKGLLALLSDSTNADVPGFTASETEIGQNLKNIFSNALGRVILTCFASSLSRIQQVSLAAAASGRKIVFDGRGMTNIVKLGKSLGYLNNENDTEISLADSLNLPDRNLVIVATGSQGEPMSALARMAYGEHRHIKIKTGDTVILSARFIPGHEQAITRLIDRFYRQGAKVVDGRATKVHASGHGQAEELKLMLNLTRPRHLVPVHGEMRQLVKHGELALSMGWPKDQVWVLENGRRLTFTADGQADLNGLVTTGRKLVDGNRLGGPEDPVLRNRLKLADGGLVVVTVVLSADGDELLAPPKVTISGVHYGSDLDLSIETAIAVEKVISDWQHHRFCGSWPTCPPDENHLTTLMQREVRRLFRQSISRRPSIWPQIIWLP